VNGDETRPEAAWSEAGRAQRVGAWWAGPVPLWQRLLVTVLGVAALVVLFFIGLTALTIGLGLVIVLAIVAIVASWVRRLKGEPAPDRPDDSLRSGVRVIRRDEGA